MLVASIILKIIILISPLISIGIYGYIKAKKEYNKDKK